MAIGAANLKKCKSFYYPKNHMILSMDMIAAIVWNCKVIGNYLCSSPLGVESKIQNNHEWPSHCTHRWQAARNPCPPTSSKPLGGGGQAGTFGGFQMGLH